MGQISKVYEAEDENGKGKGEAREGDLSSFRSLTFFIFSSLVKFLWMGVEVPHLPKFSTLFLSTLVCVQIVAPPQQKSSEREFFHTDRSFPFVD